MRPGSSPWSATPPEGLSALRRTGGQERVRSAPRSGPMSAFVPVQLSAPAAYRPRRIPAPTPARPDFSDMSAVCVPKRPERRHYSDMSGLSTLQRTDRQERVRFPPRSGLIPAFVPVQLSAPPHTAPPHTGADSGLPRLLRHVCRMCAETARTPPLLRHVRVVDTAADRPTGTSPVCAPSGLIPAFVPVQLSRPRRIPAPRRIRRRLRPAPTSQTCLPYVCRNGQDAATTQTCPGC